MRTQDRSEFVNPVGMILRLANGEWVQIIRADFVLEGLQRRLVSVRVRYGKSAHFSAETMSADSLISILAPHSLFERAYKENLLI